MNLETPGSSCSVDFQKLWRISMTLTKVCAPDTTNNKPFYGVSALQTHTQQSTDSLKAMENQAVFSFVGVGADLIPMGSWFQQWAA